MAFKKGMYIINGVERMVVADGEKETIADVLRRIGLTGVKIGCGVGQCGACTVLLDGKPIRACVRKWGKLPEHSRIETIEALGTAANPHPLQLAWIKYGGVQCGYCTPGFIVSAKGLLDVNPSPTRKEVRDWFTKNQNLCRCTGYKQLVDAVMAAAEVMRGEKPIDSLKYDTVNGKVYNARYPRPTALAKVLGVADYGYDMSDKMPEGTLHLAVTWSTEHHAKILNIDISEAEKMPGVEKVILHSDVKGTNNLGGTFNYPRCSYVNSSFPVLSSTKVMRLGAAIALVAADTEEHARAAAAKVKVDYEPLPTYANALEAVVPDAVPIHDGQKNLFFDQPMLKGKDTRPIFEQAEEDDSDIVAVEASFTSPREPHLTIEPSIAQAYFDEEGKLTIHCKTQWIFANRALIASIVGLDVEKVRVIQNNTGGAFGSTMCPDCPALCAVGAAVTGRPVILNLNNLETLRLSGKRPPCFTNAKMAVNKTTGKIEAVEWHNLLDIGGYLWSGPDQVLRMTALVGMNYSIPNIRGLMHCGMSNQPFNVAYRSWGCPEVLLPSEVIMDMAADAIGADRFEFRYNNTVEPGDTNANCGPYVNYTQKTLLDMLRPAYKEALEWKKEPAEPGWKRGVGVATGGYHVSNPGDVCELDLALNPDGSVTCFTGWQEMGQCSDVGSFQNAYEALKPLGLRQDQIHLYMNDSDYHPNFGCSAGSRCHTVGGIAVKDAADKLIAAMRKDDGSFRTYDEMIAEGIPVRYRGNFTEAGHEYQDPNTGHADSIVEHCNVAYVLRLEVEEATGKVRVVKCDSTVDGGVIGNYNSVDGQAIGGLHHCIGLALSEDYSDQDKQYTTPLGCGFLRCNEMPDDVNFVYYEDHKRTLNPFGSTGISEAFQSCAFSGVIAGINDAVGVWVTELPAKPEKIKAALEAKAKGEDYMVGPYFLGCDMDDVLEDIAANPV